MKILSISSKIWLFIAFLVLIGACGDDSVSTPGYNQNDAAGNWTVTRTIVTPSVDFPNGYKDVEQWIISVSGSTTILATPSGNMSGEWKSTTTFSTEHWVFQYIGPDPISGFQIKVIVEITDASPMKGTNETYKWDATNKSWLLAYSFRIDGARN